MIENKAQRVETVKFTGKRFFCHKNYNLHKYYEFLSYTINHYFANSIHFNN